MKPLEGFVRVREHIEDRHLLGAGERELGSAVLVKGQRARLGVACQHFDVLLREMELRMGEGVEGRDLDGASFEEFQQVGAGDGPGYGQDFDVSPIGPPLAFLGALATELPVRKEDRHGLTARELQTVRG